MIIDENYEILVNDLKNKLIEEFKKNINEKIKELSPIIEKYVFNNKLIGIIKPSDSLNRTIIDIGLTCVKFGNDKLDEIKEQAAIEALYLTYYELSNNNEMIYLFLNSLKENAKSIKSGIIFENIFQLIFCFKKFQNKNFIELEFIKNIFNNENLPDWLNKFEWKTIPKPNISDFDYWNGIKEGKYFGNLVKLSE